MNTDTEHQIINNLSILKFTGADTLSFLQGQLTNDLNALSSSWQYSGYCNPKGRLLALFQLWRDGDDFYATIDTSILEATLKRLRMYVMRSKVVIEEIANATFIGDVAGENNKVERFQLDIDGPVHTLHFGDRSLLIDFSGALKGASGTSWQQAIIRAGEPNININNAELFVPQMVNLDLLDGINFKKGCYTGQEIVARMHYLGKLKQRMYVCELDGDSASGEKIMTDNKAAGNIVSASENIALAVIRREFLDHELTTDSGAKITPLLAQPYAIPD